MAELYQITEQAFAELKPWSDSLLSPEGRLGKLMVPSVNGAFADPFDIVSQECDFYVLRRSEGPGLMLNDEAAKIVVNSIVTGKKINSELPDYLQPYGHEI